MAQINKLFQPTTQPNQAAQSITSYAQDNKATPKCATSSARQVKTEGGIQKKTPSVPIAQPTTQPSQASQSFISLAPDNKAQPDKLKLCVAYRPS